MKKIKVLVVEDEAIIGMDLEERLVHLGYEVLDVVASKEQCLEAISKQEPDIVLLDIMLRGKPEGLETANLIREKYHIPILYLTAHTDLRTIQSAKETFPYGFIHKPFNDVELKQNIENTLQTAKNKNRDS